MNVVLYHCCGSLEHARMIAREGFSAPETVRMAEQLSPEHARPPDDFHAVVVLGVPWDFRLEDYPVDGATGERIVPVHVLNLFERAVWSV